MKRHGGEDSIDYGNGRGNSAGKRQKPDSYRDAIAAGKYELRALVSSRNAGGIIGKGGENIKRLRSTFDATLTVPDSQTPERIMTICASVDNVLSCLSDILKKLQKELEKDRREESHDLEFRLLVHQSHAGAVIGRGGSKIKEIREETGAQLKVFSQPCPQSSERVVQINGSPDTIVACVRILVNMLKEIPIKGLSRPYESIFYDPQFTNDYGGFPPDRNYIRSSLQNYNVMRNAVYDNYGSSLSRIPRNLDAGFGGRSLAPSPFIFGPQRTIQVTIPNELGGTIIGKGGERINRIREESGAQITIEPPQENSERIITIIGTQAQLQTAQFLLQQCYLSNRESSLKNLPLLKRLENIMILKLQICAIEDSDVEASLRIFSTQFTSVRSSLAGRKYLNER